MQWILLQHHDGNTPSKYRKQVTAGAIRSREVHLIRLHGHRDGQAVTGINRWSPMPLSKLHTNLLQEPILQIRVRLALRTWQALPMHPQ